MQSEALNETKLAVIWQEITNKTTQVTKILEPTSSMTLKQLLPSVHVSSAFNVLEFFIKRCPDPQLNMAVVQCSSFR